MKLETLVNAKRFTVKVADTFVLSRKLINPDENWQPEYTFAVETIDMPKSPNFAARRMLAVYWCDGARRVYLGELRDGEVRLTMKSAFPAHATRVRVCQRVVAAVASGNADKIAAAGWEVVA